MKSTDIMKRSASPRIASPALLILEDGKVFRGRSYGAEGQTLGEVVFSTSMTGYQETLTDPSCHRQIVVMTAPHVGNTGVNVEDPESARIWVAGFVVRDPSRLASNWRAKGTLDDDLYEQFVVGIQGVDTRAITRYVRNLGAMRGGIFSGEALILQPDGTADIEAMLEIVQRSPGMMGADLSMEVTTSEPYTVEPIGEPLMIEDRVATIVALDLGIKAMTPCRFAQRGVRTIVVPANATVDEVMAYQPHGVFASNGPGDPAVTDAPVEVIREVLDRRLPFFGICCGNELFGRALGFGTYKLVYGHRGINQPVRDKSTGRVEITAHNHGFAVDAPLDEVVPAPFDNGRFGLVEVSHVCLNDDVVEGLRLLERPAFSVQYHPEAAAGPHDAVYLFDRFIELLKDPGMNTKKGAN